jgi:DNA-directed RNA polymerase specialized sigma24 family protein
MHIQQAADRDELRARFTVWLEVLLRRARTKYLKREAIHIPQMSLEELQEDEWPVAPEPAIPKAGFEFEEDRYNQAFSALSPREQQLLTLLLVYDYSPAEAATLLSYKKIQTLYSDKHRAIKKMRAILCNKEDYHRKE